MVVMLVAQPEYFPFLLSRQRDTLQLYHKSLWLAGLLCILPRYFFSLINIIIYGTAINNDNYT
jgi:hypothetical protein